ncbi:hypothetical protein [uncultured Nocardioides sp.]|uniref:hypothetical protein n=1 Tax=uncultured Nocardioides sp. TaxID=198441 RepID=UPI002636DBB5|nr:hypothetical protein [uncultured Nocardioides sp.]
MSTSQHPAQSPAPVKSSDDYFNSSRLRVIAMITAATLAVGALGGIAGVAFDPDPVPKDHVIQPGGTARGFLGSVGGPGNASPRSHGAATPFAARLPAADATDSPSPLGTIGPGDGSSQEPTDQGDTGDNGDSGSSGGGGTTIEATDVDIFVPNGWDIDFQDENRVFQSNGRNSFSFAFSFVGDPTLSSGDVITDNLTNILPAENYTQLRTSDVQTLQPFGSVVSLSGLEYEALWVDNQGSISIHGQIYVAVRQDGTVLGIEVEHAPAEEFTDAFDEMVPILDNSYARFGGLG